MYVNNLTVLCSCCKKVLCNVCNHTHIQQTKVRLVALSGTLKVQLDLQNNYCGKIKKCKTSVDTKKNDILSLVNKLFHSLTVLLQKRKTEILNEVNVSFEDDYKVLHALQESKEVNIAVLSSSIHSIMDVTEREGVSLEELISTLDSVQKTLPAECEEEIPKSVNVTKRDFTYDTRQLEDYIAKIGKVTSNEDSVAPVKKDGLGLGMMSIVESPPRLVHSSPIIRDSTFIIKRPSKAILMEIPVKELILSIPRTLSQSLQCNYKNKSDPIIVFGNKGVGPGEFIWPRGVAVDFENVRILVADSSNHRVQVFSDTGLCQKVISEMILTNDHYDSSDCRTNLDCLSGISIDQRDRIICSDRYNHRAVILDIDGQLLKEIGKDGSGESLLSYPWGIAINCKGSILICDKDNHRVQVFAHTGEHMKQIGTAGKQPGQFDTPHYLAVCPKTQNIFVSDTSNHRIQVFTKNGDFLSSFTGTGQSKYHLKYPRGIAVDVEGNVVVCDSGNNRISIFTNGGDLVHMIGCHGSGAGQFKGLEGIAVFKDGRIVVSDRDNHRIQIF